VITYEDLGSEAIYRLKIKDFPAIVINDIFDGDFYDEAQNHYKTISSS